MIEAVPGHLALAPARGETFDFEPVVRPLTLSPALLSTLTLFSASLA